MARGDTFLRQAAGAVAGALVVGVVTFLALLGACDSVRSGCDGDPNPLSTEFGAAFLGVLAFAGSLAVISVVLVIIHAVRTRPDEPEWP